MVTINEVPVAVRVASWSANEVKFFLPAEVRAGTEVYMGVVVGGQMSANALPFKVQ